MEKGNDTQAAKKETPFMDLIFNLLIPVLVLKKADNFVSWDPTVILMVALAFPLCFGIKDFVLSKKVNIFSVLGLVNVLLTGVIGLFELSPAWVAVKEAAIPGLIGIAVVVSMWTPYPLVKTLLYNPKILQTKRIDQKLEENGSKDAFDGTLQRATWYLAASFLVSSVLNYVLAKIMVTTSPAVDKEMFNNEISSMWLWSMVVIVVPSMIVMMVALWTIFRGIKTHTGLTMEDVMVGMEEEKTSPSKS